MARFRLALAVLAVCGAAPAFAHDHGTPPPPPGWYGAAPPAMPYAVPAWPGPDGQAAGRAYASPTADPEYQRMIERCRVAERDRHVGGALIGGAVGGLVGNRVASGDRVLGTVAGAAVGAITGAAIDKAEDKGHDRECADFFQRYGPPQGGPGGYAAAYPGYGYPGYSPGYGAPYGYMMVPVMIQGQQKPCVETTTVTEEWVDAPRRRVIPRRPVVRDKRVKEKRVYIGS